MSLSEKRREFNANIWNHAVDPFQTKFDVCKPLTHSELEAFANIAAVISDTEDDSMVARRLQELIVAQGSALTARFLQISGLTRSKILTDLKAADVSVAVPSHYQTLHTSPSWQFGGIYLARCLRRVFRHLVPFDAGACEAINQATYPGFIRQERAKRQGHEAELRLATLLEAVEIPFQPLQKAHNPLCPDVAIHGVSFDLVIPDVENPQVVVKSTVHTSNIGQYGESKDALEMDEARRMLDANFASEQRPLLLAMIDGVGFFSNKAGLDGILSSAGEFCQFRTLWKAVVVSASRLGWTTTLSGPGDYFNSFADFLDNYGPCPIENLSDEGIEAGEAYVQVTKRP